MKQVEFAKDFTTDIRYRFPNANVQRLGSIVLVSKSLETVTISSLRNVVTIKYKQDDQVNKYVTDWKKAFKPNMVAVSIDKVAELLGL